MLKIQTIINYNKQDIKQREREFDVEKDPKMVELNDMSKKFKHKYIFWMIIMFSSLFVGALLSILKNPYISIVQIIMMIIAIISLCIIPSTTSKQLKTLTQQELLRKISTADILFHSFVGDSGIENCILTQISEPYCTIKVSVVDVDYNIREQEILFLYQEIDIEEPVLDISKQTLFVPKKEKYHD